MFLATALFACAFVVRVGVRSESIRFVLIACLAIMLPVLAAALRWTPPAASFAESHTPQKIEDQGYVSSETCRACHVAEYESWYRSYHRTMTQVASPRSVVAPHESVSVLGNGRRLEVDFEDEVMWAEDIHPYATLDRLAATVQVIPGPSFVSTSEPMIPANIRRVRSQVVMTTGSHHMQIYWYRDAKGAFRHLSWVWLIRDQRWVPGEAVYLQPPSGVMGLAGQWETNCIKCHSVGGQPRLSPNRRSSPRKRARPSRGQPPPPRESKVGELGIACEGCHGPAKEHVEANRNPLRRYALYLEDADDPSIVHPKKISHERASEICGRCHSGHTHMAWDPSTGTPFKPGESLEEFVRLRHYDTQPPEERSGYFWNDGTARVTGREYSAMIRSACYTRGELECNSCHSMHNSEPDDQLSADRNSDASCLECHADFANRIEEHTHHPTESSGARCYNCHMPNTTYGLLSMTRSHRIDNPSVEMTTEAGRPNACNLCHVDQTLAWTSDHLSAWYGQQQVPLAPEEREVPAAVLWLLKGDAAQRATAAWHFGWGPVRERAGTGWQTPLLARSLADPYTAVRYLAERSLRRFPGFEELTYDFVEPGKSQSPAVKAALELSAPWVEESSLRIREDLVDRLQSERDSTPISFQE